MKPLNQLEEVFIDGIASDLFVFAERYGGEVQRGRGRGCGWQFRPRRDASTPPAQGRAHSETLRSRKEETSKLQIDTSEFTAAYFQ